MLIRSDLSSLRFVIRQMRLRPQSVAVAVIAACITLLAALGLSAVSAWLITRAWQMPPVLALGIAVTAVRALGVTRGVFRYVDRILGHEVALTGIATLRSEIFTRISASPEAAARVTQVPRGDLVQRLGTDADTVGDAVVRGLIPMVVSWVMLLCGTGLIAVKAPLAALTLMVGLVLTTFVVPWIAILGTASSESSTIGQRSRLSAMIGTTFDATMSLRLSGRLDAHLAQIQQQQAELEALHRRSARRLAWAAALAPVAQGVSLLGSLVVATYLLAGSSLSVAVPSSTAGNDSMAAISPMWFSIIVLVPLAAFEASSVLPAAAINLVRASAAAARIVALWGSEPTPASPAPPSPANTTMPVTTTATVDAPYLLVKDLVCGHSSPILRGFNLTVNPGERIVITGPSGSGKSTLLHTLSGGLAPLGGRVAVHGHKPGQMIRPGDVQYFAEDAHIFDTSLRENLRLTHGNASDEELMAALIKVGLGEWASSLPDGLETDLSSSARNVSGGQRRRVLLARAILSISDVILLDEPTEHLDDDTAIELLHDILLGDLFTARQAVLVVTHHPSASHFNLKQIRIDDFTWSN